MYILHITRETGADSRYGIRKSLLPVIGALRLRGHKVEIFDQSGIGSVRLNPVESFLAKQYIMQTKLFGNQESFAGKALSERIGVCLKAAKYAAKQKVTHVHCHDPLLGHAYHVFAKFFSATKRWGYTNHAFGRFAKLRMGLKCDESSLAVLRSWEDKAVRQARFVINPAQSGLVQMMQDMNIESMSSNFHVIPHAIAISRHDREQARKLVGIKENERLILAVGQLAPMKRFGLLLRSVAILPLADQLRVIILGEGSEKEMLMGLAKELNIDKYFEIRTTDEIGLYLSAADVYVSVSSTESFGIANCEAVMAGVPAVCTKVDAVPEVLNDSATLTGDDPKEIASAIHLLLTNETLREDLVKNARLVSANWPTGEQTASRYETIYLNCK